MAWLFGAVLVGLLQLKRVNIAFFLALVEVPGLDDLYRACGRYDGGREVLLITTSRAFDIGQVQQLAQ